MTYEILVAEIDPTIEPHPDALLSLDAAELLPECWTAVTVRQLRGAIARGELRIMRLGSRIRTTRQWIRDWRERCGEDGGRTCGSSLPSTTKGRVASGSGPSGASRTTKPNCHWLR
jgi:hypothetical protein